MNVMDLEGRKPNKKDTLKFIRYTVPTSTSQCRIKFSGIFTKLSCKFKGFQSSKQLILNYTADIVENLNSLVTIYTSHSKFISILEENHNSCFQEDIIIQYYYIPAETTVFHFLDITSSTLLLLLLLIHSLKILHACSSV